jgi:beta-mannanase
MRLFELQLKIAFFMLITKKRNGWFNWGKKKEKEYQEVAI